MELKQYFFITAKDNEVLKACFIMQGTDKGLQLITQVIESNKLIFGGVILPSRLDDRISHLSKYCSQYSEYADLVPSYDSSQGAEEIIVQVIDTGIIQESYFSDGLKEKVVILYNRFKENGPTVSDVQDSPQCVEMPPPRPPPDVKQRKPSEMEIQMRKLAESSEKAWNESKKILRAVEDLHKEMASIRSNQECMSNRLDDVAVNNVATSHQGKKFKCSYCKNDEHGYKECGLKEQCVNCGIDNHKSDKCFWSGNNCSWCGTTGHASKLHHAKDQKFRLAIMNAHGHEHFSHFWADQPPAPVQVEVPVEPVTQERVHEVQERAQQDGNRGTNRRGRGSRYGRNAKQHEAKPYQRSHVDPWAGPYKPFKGANRSRR